MTTLFKNNAASKLASGLSVGATSMNVTPGDGDKFPVVAAPNVAYVTIENATYTEIVKITARASGSDSMTIVKAQEGTTDRAWLTGDTVSLRLTAAQAELGANAQAVAAAAMTAHEAAADPHPGYTTAAELLAAVNTLQPLDAELTSLALMDPARVAEITALSAFIGSLLNDADQATALSTLGALLNGILSKSAAYSIVAADRGKLIDCTTGTWALSFDPTTATGLGAGFVFAVRNDGAGVITLTPTSGTLDGAATVDLAAGESCFVFCDGTNAKTIGHAVAPTMNPLAVTTLTSGTSHTLNSKTTRVQVEMVGGGGGGGSQDAGLGASGGGGGSGSYLKTGVLSTGGAGALTYSVGAGGNGGKSNLVSGGGGGASSVTINGTTFSAAGGAGGVAGGAPGSGGGLAAASVDRICIAGGSGAGTTGAASIFSTAAGATGNNVYGGGGGGSPAGSNNGGNGGAGLVKITEYA